MLKTKISSKMENNKIIPTKQIKDKKLKKKLRTSNFCTIWKF